MLGNVLAGTFFFLVQIVATCWTFLQSSFQGARKGEALRLELQAATQYETWRACAMQLDLALKSLEWKKNPKSKLYDYKLISHRLSTLSQARKMGDYSTMMWILRSGLIRNLGGICDARLYAQSYLGTKQLISDYIQEISDSVNALASVPPGVIKDTSYSQRDRAAFFEDIKTSFGNTALLLQGGASFGLFHLGVIKALNSQSLLPRIISGSSIGALIAALVCIHTDEVLPEIFQERGINLQAFARTGHSGSISRKVKRFLKHGYLMDVKILEDCVRSNVGDITFEEAYRKTNRILNIVVSSKRKNEIPRLLNYLTAPNVLIWSAACASAAVVGLYDTVDLLAKDTSGNIVHWSPSTIKWSDATSESDSPEMRLAELFNVNHFILSQASPITAPFVSRNLQDGNEGILTRLCWLIAGEVRHRVMLLGSLGLLPRSILALLDQKYIGNVTIAPHLESKDFYTLFSSPTYASLHHWILKGEQATWPYLAYIRNRCRVELELDKVIRHLKSKSKDRASG